ncbi:PspC domain-containing protein [Lactococcus insecticola]|uniref:Phage shock protein PspC N-terminal domain-containing protein n=1 Tax=Pseudolactococcus insecticola TaxID=2709158 RepID=A0A6A0BBK3_9LACT|nr:PspC domain-containing protein [Lactococcus insecticola]GFH41217.1 hypothetical protein Hs20B_16150 [Lactococcus insecticola]
MAKQLTKSRQNKMVSGVIGGIGEYFNLSRDVITIIRIVYTVIALTSFGSLLLIYIIAAFIMPRQAPDMSGKQQDFAHFSGMSGNTKTETKKRKDVTPFDDDDDWSQF